MLLTAACPNVFTAAVEHYVSGSLWREVSLPRDLIHPHDMLLRRTVARLGLLDANSHKTLRRRGFAAHVTPRAWPVENVGLCQFKDEEDVLSAISASCCLHPSGVRHRGKQYLGTPLLLFSWQ